MRSGGIKRRGRVLEAMKIKTWGMNPKFRMVRISRSDDQHQGPSVPFCEYYGKLRGCFPLQAKLTYEV